jgi:ABC-type glycerol-3-phosphate transport system permease component
MLETPHVAVGAAIAIKVANPALSLPLALGSHFLLDRIPHWNPHTYTETIKYGRLQKSSLIIAGVDTALALALGLSIAFSLYSDYTKIATVIAACFLSVLPDLVKSPFYLFKNRNRLLKKYVNFERSIQVETNVYVGMFVQVIIILLSVWWILG